MMGQPWPEATSPAGPPWWFWGPLILFVVGLVLVLGRIV